VPRGRRLMETSLPLRLPSEMLADIGEVHVLRSDPGFLEGVGENRAGRADERLTLLVFDVAGLLTDQHQGSRLRPDAKHDLCGAR
jgi:hypothetical protein